MQRDGGNLLSLFLRKYILIILLTIMIYSICLLFLLVNNDLGNVLEKNIFDIFLVIMFNAFLIRLLDDYKDYDYDKKLSKAIFSKRVLVFLVIALLILSILFSYFVHLWFNLLILVYIIACANSFFQKKYDLSVLKIFILPLLISYTYIATKLEKNILCYLFIALSIIISTLYLIIKKKRLVKV